MWEVFNPVGGASFGFSRTLSGANAMMEAADDDGIFLDYEWCPLRTGDPEEAPEEALN